MKVLRVQPMRIPQLWDAIKFVAINADGVPEKERKSYLSNLLIGLLNGKIQCFVRMDDNRMLMAMALTKIIAESDGTKSLFIISLYSFQKVADEQWISDMAMLEDFGRQSGCKRVLTNSVGERAFYLDQTVGFTELYRCFAKEL